MNNSSSPLHSGKARHFEYCTAPVFIFGAHRSGTTALAHALAKHPDFWASEETFFLDDLFGHGRAESVHQNWVGRPSSSWLSAQSVSSVEFLEALGLGINALFTDRSGGSRWIDHTPHYVLCADTLAGMFPGARFIHVLRDGREVVHSMIHIAATLTPEERSRMDGKFLPDWATNFRVACDAWKKLATAGMNFCATRSDCAVTVVNREMESDPAGTMSRILKFLGANYHEDCADFLRKRRINSSFQPPGGFDASQYSRPQPWENWSMEQRRIFVEVAGQTLCEFGLASPEELAIDEAGGSQ
jgi:hypothetical protein